LERGYVIKPDGLTGGKGVKVSGTHLATFSEGLAYARDVIAHHNRVIVEESSTGKSSA